MADQVPSIVVMKSADLGETKVEEKICWGIEEESIPFEVQSAQEHSAVRLAYRAALSSRLNVGIGIGTDQSIAIHYSHMDEDTPLFLCAGDSKGCNSVNLGINAARLVKGLPFKEV